MYKRSFILLILLIISFLQLPVLTDDDSEFIPQTKEDVEKLMDELNPTTLDQLPEEVQSTVKQTLEKFQGGFMRSPASPYYFLKSSSLTMIFKESEILLRIPQYEVKSPETERDLNKLNDMNRQSPNMIGMTEVVLHFPGSNLVEPSTAEPQSARYNYFKGDESQWIRNSPYYQKLVYRNLYDNIDLVYDMTNGELKYDFLVHPGGDYHEIELEWLGDLYITQLDEGLVISLNTPDGVFPITDNNPINFIGSERNEEISGEFTIVDENSYGFSIEEYDSSKELIIDPKVDLGFSTLLGGSGDDFGWSIALDTSDNVYITGHTADSTIDFPTTPDVFNKFHTGSYDVFVSKLSSDCSSLIFSTLLGGSGNDFGHGIAVDASNNIYITGYTLNSSINFPTTSGALNESHNGLYDVFVVKLSSNGSVFIFSTLLGGSASDYAEGIVLDNTNNIYITGSTYNSTTNFPTSSGSFNETHSGQIDVFVTKLSADGTTLIFSTLIGGSANDIGSALVLGPSNNVYITGRSDDSNTDFPTTSGVYNEIPKGNFDVFVTKLSSDGSTLIFSTLIGGSSVDAAYAIALDSSNCIYITGSTVVSTIDFPTTSNGFDESHNGATDVFVTKLSSDASNLIFSTLIGGSEDDAAHAITLDAFGNVYITGSTSDYPPAVAKFPTTLGAYNNTNNGFNDVFVTKLSSDGANLQFSTLLGGTSSEFGRAIVLDKNNNPYITGETYYSTNGFPTSQGVYNEIHNGGSDVFVAKIIVEEVSPPDVSGPYGLTYNIGSTGNQINWDIGDVNPGSYNITLDGILVETQTNWYNGTISLIVDSLNLGQYNYTVHVYDNWGNLKQFSTIVTVTFLNLKIDLGFSTLLGGSSTDEGYAIALDTSGNIYITGNTYDFDSQFPTTPNAYNETHNGFDDVFVTKISSDGSNLIFSTLIGGSDSEYARDITLDISNNIYITGYTFDSSINFPTTSGAFNESHNGESDVFVTKLSLDGSTLMFSTLLGGSGYDFGDALSLDTSNNVYITGYTSDSSTNFPTTVGAYNETHNGVDDVFVTKLSSNGSSLMFSTLMGGSARDWAFAIVLDTFNNVYVTGLTIDSTIDFPTTPDVFNEFHTGSYDVFVSKLSSDGSSLIFSTLLGGSSMDTGYAIALDGSNNVYITGHTKDSATDFPTTSGAYNETHNGNFDVFVTKLSSDGSSLIFSTLLGGSIIDTGYAIALDADDNIYISGVTQDDTIDYPTTPGAYNETHNGYNDVFLTKLSSDGSNLIFSTLLGGINIDLGYALALDDSYNVYITGWSSSYDFPTTSGVYDETWNGQNDAFVTKIIVEEFNSPDVSLMSDTVYELGTTGHQINWYVQDQNPESYNITFDDIIVESQPSWTNGNISWNIDGLSLGEYNYSIYLQDYWGNLAIDSVIIIVEDTIPPELFSLNDKSIEYKTTDNQLTWVVGDLLPNVYNITLDGEIYNSTLSWTNGTITSNIDNLTLGQHTFTIYVYDTSGNLISSSVIVTVEDMIDPIISSSQDVIYELGSADNIINWVPSDHDPLGYQVLLNGSEIETGLWNSSQSIILDVDALYVGVHNFTIVVLDGSGNRASHSIFVEVFDTVDPEIIDVTNTLDNPIDLTYEQGSIGNSITWIVSDLDPGTYQIFHNSSRIKSGEWISNEDISVTVNGYPFGFHNITIVTFDISGNSISNTIVLQVMDTIDPTFDLTKNLELNGEIIAGGSMLILIEDLGGIPHIQYKWNDGELITVYPDNSSLRLSQELQGFYFTIPVPEELVNSEATLFITAYDTGGNVKSFSFDVSVVSGEGQEDLLYQLLIYIGYFLVALIVLIIIRKQLQNYSNKKKLMKISSEIGLDGVYPDIFISFSSKDIKIGEQLFYKLHDNELNPWISSRKIKAGEDYSLKILDAIDNSKLFILLISKESIKSRHIKAELERAFSKEREIFPIRLDNSEIPKSWEYFLSTSQWIDVDGLSTKKWISEMIEIFKEKFGESVGDTIDNLLESFRSFEGDETRKG